MLKIGACLLVIAIILGAVRLYTGIVYAYDAETAYFVLKHTPSLTIQRRETLDQPVTQDIVLADDELQVAFGDLYVSAMRLVPAFMAVLAAGAALLFGLDRWRQNSRVV